MQETLGYLASCMDRRFLDATRKVFEKTTGLSSIAYWQEAWPGGTAVVHDELGENYAYAHGARIFGWQAHGSKCGGQPEISDETIQERLDAMIAQKLAKFPDARHYRIFATEGNISIVEVAPNIK